MAELETLLSDAVSTVSKLKETIGSSETNEALVELKKETASHVIDKLAEKRADIKIEWAKSLVVDYLVTEWFLDSFWDEIIKAWLDTFISSSKELQNLKEVIAENNTEEWLKNLESSILSHLESWWVFDDAWKNGITPSPTPHSDQSQDNQETATQTATEQEEQSEPSSWEEGLEGSAEEWEAKEVELKQRMQRLFPEGVPQTEKEMKKYLRKINYPLPELWSLVIFAF